MRPRLYVVPASHPCAAAMAALRLKGIDHDVTEMPQVVHVPLQYARFRTRTVPTLRADGRKVNGSSAIFRWADERVPEPALFPADPQRRAAVERAETWGDEVLQPLARRLVWWALRRRRDAMPSYVEESRIPFAAAATRVSGRAVALAEWRLNDVGDDAVRADLRALPEHLARIGEWMEEGVLGGEQPNAADLQIGASLALLRTLGDLAPLVDQHPAGELARRWFPDYPGSVPPGVLPAA